MVVSILNISFQLLSSVLILVFHFCYFPVYKFGLEERVKEVKAAGVIGVNLLQELIIKINLNVSVALTIFFSLLLFETHYFV